MAAIADVQAGTSFPPRPTAFPAKLPEGCLRAAMSRRAALSWFLGSWGVKPLDFLSHVVQHTLAGAVAHRKKAGLRCHCGRDPLGVSSEGI